MFGRINLKAKRSGRGNYQGNYQGNLDLHVDTTFKDVCIEAINALRHLHVDTTSKDICIEAIKEFVLQLLCELQAVSKAVPTNSPHYSVYCLLSVIWICIAGLHDFIALQPQSIMTA